MSESLRWLSRALHFISIGAIFRLASISGFVDFLGKFFAQTISDANRVKQNSYENYIKQKKEFRNSLSISSFAQRCVKEEAVLKKSTAAFAEDYICVVYMVQSELLELFEDQIYDAVDLDSKLTTLERTRNFSQILFERIL